MSHRYSWGEIKQKARDYLGDQDGKIWSDDELLGYATTALSDIALNAEGHIKRIRFPLTSGTRTYALPEDLHEVRSVKINGKKIWGREAYDLQEFDNNFMTALGTSYAYYLEDLQTLAFYPIPSWTDDWSSAGTFDTPPLDLFTFSVDGGVVTDIVDDAGVSYSQPSWDYNGFYYGISSGELILILDPSNSTQYQFSLDYGIVTGINTTILICELEYVYVPGWFDYLTPVFPNPTDEPD